MSTNNLNPGENQEDLNEEENKNHPAEDEADDDLDQEEDDPNDEFTKGFDPDTDVDEDDDTVTFSKADWAKIKKSINRTKTNIIQKDHYRTKLKKVLGNDNSSNKKSMSNTAITPENKEEKKPATSSTTSQEEQSAATPKVEAENTQLAKRVDVIQLISDHQYLGKELAEELVARAQKDGVSVETIMQDKFYKPFLDQKRKDWEIEHASSHNSTTSNGSISTNDGDVDWKTASRDEVEKRVREISRGSRR